MSLETDRVQLSQIGLIFPFCNQFESRFGLQFYE